MSARSTAPEKRPGFFSQLKSLYQFSKEEYSWLPWALIGIFVGSIALGIAAGFLIPPAGWLSMIMWGVVGLMLGIVLCLVAMTRLSTTAMYRKIDGMPGAAGHVLSTSLGRSWAADDTPVGINPRTQDAVYRAIGRGGVVIVGEGSRGRLKRLVSDEKKKITRVASGVPITVLYLGHDEDDIPISRLAKTVKGLPKAIDRATMSAVVKRVDSVSQSLSSLPVPKGIDPLRARPQRPR